MTRPAHNESHVAAAAGSPEGAPVAPDAGGAPMPALLALLDGLCPLYAVLDGAGVVVHAGPTLAKILGALPGRVAFLDLFELRRPRIAQGIADLRAAAGAKLHLVLRAPPHSEMKGLVVPLPADGTLAPAGGAVVALSPGIGVAQAVRQHGLTAGDFPATDLTVEMLYLIEANSTAMAASRQLNQRLQVARVAAEEQAFTDTLTGLKNRRALECILPRLAAGAEAGTGAGTGAFALLSLDLDYFKSVNDRLGHAAGDHVLQEVAARMVAETRAQDVIVRAGGDEFLLLLPGVRRPEELHDLAQRLIARIEEPILHHGRRCRVSASIGAALSGGYPAPLDPARMIADADAALYAAKGRGRGCDVIHGQDG